jgi:hypothetical protein
LLKIKICLQILQARTSKRNGQFSKEAFAATNSVCGAKDIRPDEKTKRRNRKRK